MAASYKTEFFITPEARLAYAFVDVPRTTDINGKALDDPRYEAVAYLPKTSNDPNQCRTYQMLAGKVQEVMRAVFGGQWPKSNWKDWPIHDCDRDPQELEKAPWGRGCWRIRVSAGKYPPVVVDQGNNTMAADITGRFRNFKAAGGGGDYGLLSINCFAYDNTFGKGVSFGLDGIKKTRDGDPIGGGQRTAEQIFGKPDPNAAPPPVPGGVYGGAPPIASGNGFSPSLPPQAAPPPLPPPPPVDPSASWQRDQSGQWMLNPNTQQWEPARAAAPPPPPIPAPAYAQTPAGPAPGAVTGPSYGSSASAAPGPGAAGYPSNGMPPPPPIGTR